ncbi:MAG: sigma-70 family RNA polymerase sigma factor [Butyricimonas paravirosa]
MRPIDQEICSLLKVRKIGGMELLFREYYKPLVVWATTFLHDTQRAEDIVQDFFVKLWEKPYSAFLPETLKSYLFTSIRNLALNQLDKIDPLRQACDVAYYDSPWNEYDNFEDEVFRRVEEELEKLTPRAQDVIRKIYLEGMKYKDVADKLGISVATVNSILGKGFKKTPSTG